MNLLNYIQFQIWLPCFFHIFIFAYCWIQFQFCTHIHTHTYIYISSSSCHATSTDIPDPLSPLLPIVHRLWQVFRAIRARGTTWWWWWWWHCSFSFESVPKDISSISRGNFYNRYVASPLWVVLYSDLRPGQTYHSKDSGRDTFRQQLWEEIA